MKFQRRVSLKKIVIYVIGFFRTFISILYAVKGKGGIMKKRFLDLSGRKEKKLVKTLKILFILSLSLVIKSQSAASQEHAEEKDTVLVIESMDDMRSALDNFFGSDSTRARNPRELNTEIYQLEETAEDTEEVVVMEEAEPEPVIE